MNHKTLKPESIEHRKRVAAKYGFDEQEIIDMPKREFKNFCIGLEVGEKYGARKVIDSLKKEQEKELKELQNAEESDK